MAVAGNEAWVTSAVRNGDVDKAIVLAGSFRRVRTARKLVVLTTLGVSEDLREKLMNVFDLVLLLDRKSSNGLTLEEYAKIKGFSLLAFNKCVYLSPNALVLENCDEIFGKYSTFACSYSGMDNEIDHSVYFYIPSLETFQALNTMEKDSSQDGALKGSKYFGTWLKNNIPNMERLDDQYNLKLKLNGNFQGLNSRASIFNFIDVHPLDYPRKIRMNTTGEMGVMEKFVVDQCWRIYMEDIMKSPGDSTWLHPKTQYKVEPVAIVGMSFRLPGGNDVDEFWSLLSEGRNAVVPVPSHRWTKEHSYFSCKDRKVEAGFLNVPIDQFDSKFFGLSPKEAEFVDPQQRLLMEVTWEALEDAMIDPLKLRGTKTGVFVGSWIYDYKDMLSRSVDVDFFRTYMGNSVASTAARISHFLETTGPSIATESGCSSAIAALDMACKSLRNCDSDIAVAAGVNLLLRPFHQSEMGFVLSPDYRCKTFDANANGFARGEACAALLMKRLSDAVKDGDRIWGLIRGSALTQEGVSKSLGTPTVHCESLAMELALRDAGVDPKDVSYIEAHGTGTSVGDPMEIMAINKAYSNGRTEPIFIGSVKTNVGHTESVSGITGIIKVVLSMKNEMIPKHLNLKTLNPQIDLDVIPAMIPLAPVPWPINEGKPRIAGVSSFGISGTDGHAIIEEPPRILTPKLVFQQERPLHVMKISTKSTESMDELILKYLKIFNEKIESNQDSEIEFANMAYTANVGRATFNHRAVIMARNFTEAAKILKEKSFKQTEVQYTGSKLCFLFTGQGSQYPNMAKQLYETSPIFKANFDKCDSVLQEKYNISIKNVLWTNAGSSEINRTLYSQTSIFVVEYCLLELWKSWGVKPDYVMGHSLGEFAAAVAAGALDFEHALKLVAERSRLIDQLPKGKMLVIKADKEKVGEMISELQKIKSSFWVDYAALNSPEQTVVAGDSGVIEEFSNFCREKSLKTIVLAATHAFHSRHMDPMLDAYGRIAKTVKKPQLKDNLPRYISGMYGKLIDVESIDVDYWVRHTREKVRFTDACRAIQDQGCQLFLEVGPHPVLSALTIMNTEGHAVTCLPSMRRQEEEWVTLLDSLGKLYLSQWKGEIDWNGFDRFYERKRAKLPFYPFNRKPTWAKIESEKGKIHPLIGSIMPTSTYDTIFQNSLTLKNVQFAQDHVIGNTVIFPGAGFLEICLAGGHATVQGFTEDMLKPRRPIVLKSLKIASPLALQESGVCKVQTVVALNDKHDDDDELGYSIGVYRFADGNWVDHATAKFLPMAPSLSEMLTEPIDIMKIQSSWEKTDNKDFYEKLPEVGLRFGPQFQSLESGWKSEKGILVSVKVPQNLGNYLIHPVIADAMIQAVMLWTSKETLRRKLQVPVQIGEFIWLKEAETSTQFVYCSRDGKNSYCILVDETGFMLAYMKGVDFIETTPKLVEGMITQQSTAMPKLWQDVWKSSRGPMQGYLTHESPLSDLDFSEEDLEYFRRKNNIDEDELKFCENLIRLTRYSILKALYILGWNPEIKQILSVDHLLKSLKIIKNFRHYIKFFLRSMAKDDFKMLKVMDEEETTFQFVMPPPTMEELEEGLKFVTNPADFSREQYKLIMELEKSLSQILTGEVAPLSILFPEDCEKPSAKKFYERSYYDHQTSRPTASKTTKHRENAERCYAITPKASQSSPIYRILEVGAGTGLSTRTILNEIIPRTTEVEYVFTDVSAAFFNAIEKELEEFKKSLVFKKYDIDEDPLEQGMCPGYFDFIMGAEVFHVAKNIRKTMRSVRSLLKPGGLIVIYETICPDERITFVFGLLDGYWQFEDTEFRNHHTTLTPKMWTDALTEAGFHGIEITPMYNNIHGVITAFAAPVENTFLMNLRPSINSWIIFDEHNDFSNGLNEKFLNVNRKCVIIPKPTEFTEKSMEKFMKNALALSSEGGHNLEGIVYLWSLSPSTRDQSKLSLPFLTLCKLMSEFKNPPKTFAVTRGACPIESSVVIDPTPGTLLGFCKALANENLDMSVTCLDLDPNQNAIKQIDELFMNLWVDHKQGAAFRDGLRLCPKLTEGKIAGNEPLPLPGGCDRFQLVLPETKSFADLVFGHLEPFRIEDNEVEIQIKAMALNFRDVFAVLKPIPIFEKINSVGLDFSGIVVKAGGKVTKVKVGDWVMGMVQKDNLSLPSHYKTEEKKIILVPKSMTFAEGATLPAVFSTAVYCLINIAKIKRGETILIHTASGGVGLVAIQLCTYIGANVIGTAGCQRKRQYLRNLGIKHVFHSRTTDFKMDILEVTKGRGVDVVLNSLTGPGFKEASLDVLTNNGRFIEMSKLNVWNKEEVERIRPDVFYEIVDLTALEAHQYESLTAELRKFMEAGSIKPIAYEVFDALNIRGALNYLQKAKHIGKIVCRMPEVKAEKSRLTAITPLFNEDSTYLVTGGLGGIGFEVVKWMLMKGAKHIAVLSRGSPKPEIASQFEAWNNAGKHVQSFPVDVGNYEMVKALLDELKMPELGFPQVRGIMHAAGVLQDALLENQTWDKFTKTYNPKVDGSWNFHDLTKDYLLEHFVLFSSIAATFGSPGQTNHSASNAFQDCLAAYRRSNGLPATVVNWGNWGEVGVATEVDFPGMRPISTKQGLLALETFLRTQTAHMCVLNVESFSLLLKLYPQVKHYLDDCRLLGDVKTLQIMNSDDFWKEVDSAEDREGKVGCFKKFIKTVVRNILKMDADEPIADQAEFQTLGIDSLMMLEMKNGMQTVLGARMTLTANQLKDCNNTEVLANTLVDILDGEHDDKKDLLNKEEFRNLVRDDSNLLPGTLSTLNLESTPIDQVKIVLLTGATGNLGPYLLSELIQRTQITMVYCLIRPNGKQNGLERLKRRLQQLNITEQIDFEKVEVIEGDITMSKFGLNDTVYIKLCEDVEAVIHSAVKADHYAKYWKAPETRTSHVRTVNVLGTVRLLEFAAERTLKHFFHASTILAFAGMGKDGKFSEGWQSVGAFDSFEMIRNMGYFVTKHISEQLVYQAILKGIPCKAFRFPHIAGDSRDGRVDYQQNHVILRWLTCMKIGAIHDLPSPMTTISVDRCAKISLNIFFNPDAPLDVYNIVQKHIEVEQVLVEVAQSFGINMKIVSYETFLEKLKAEGENSPVAAFIKLYVDAEAEFIANFKNPSNQALIRYLEDSENFLDTSKLSKYAPEYDNCVETLKQVLLRDFTFLKNEGVFEKYGIMIVS